MKCAPVHISTLEALKGGSSTIKHSIKVSEASVAHGFNQMGLIFLCLGPVKSLSVSVSDKVHTDCSN